MIEVYSKTNCPQCDLVKQQLTAWGYDFREIRVDQDDLAREFLISRGHRSVPQIYHGEKLLIPLGVQGLNNIDREDFDRRLGDHSKESCA
jgi:glutaredoxin